MQTALTNLNKMKMKMKISYKNINYNRIYSKKCVGGVCGGGGVVFTPPIQNRVNPILNGGKNYPPTHFDVIMMLKAVWRHQDAKIAFLGFLMTSSLLKVSIMTQMDINFCISLFFTSFWEMLWHLIKTLLFYMGFSI